MTGPVVVILAAGEGTRMRSATPKLLHPLCGRAMIHWPVAAAQAAGASRSSWSTTRRAGWSRTLSAASGAADVALAIQAQPRGTADAVKAAAEFLGAGTVIVLNGDVPLIRPETIQDLAQAHERAQAGATIATMRLHDPSGYGRVVRDADGWVLRVVETKHPGDASPDELAIDEVNAGVYAFDAGRLARALERVRADNAQGEYYLPDVLAIIRAGGAGVGGPRAGGRDRAHGDQRPGRARRRRERLPRPASTSPTCGPG